MDAYEEVKVIGKGSFGVVTQIVRKSDGKSLVWKEVNYGTMSEKEKQLIVSEVNILRELRHPHIVRYLDRVIDKQATKIYIVMEYCEGGDLSQLIRRKKREGSYIEEGFIWHIFTHIFLALKECHRHREGNVIRPILHRDIKPGNIFLDANHNAKLGDFGLAKELSSESRFAQTNVGTPYYMSPEMVNEMTYDERSDIWALGCLLYEMATLSPPFDATNQLALAKKINAGRFNRIPAQYSEPLYQVIRWMLHRQRSRRPRIEDLERCPQLAQRLRAYGASPTSGTPSNNASTPERQLQEQFNHKMKELMAIEEDLQRQQTALTAREKKLNELEAELNRREADLKRREIKWNEQLMLMNRRLASSPTSDTDSSSPTSRSTNQLINNSPNRRLQAAGLSGSFELLQIDQSSPHPPSSPSDAAYATQQQRRLPPPAPPTAQLPRKESSDRNRFYRSTTGTDKQSLGSSKNNNQIPATNGNRHFPVEVSINSNENSKESTPISSRRRDLDPIALINGMWKI